MESIILIIPFAVKWLGFALLRLRRGKKINTHSAMTEIKPTVDVVAVIMLIALVVRSSMNVTSDEMIIGKGVIIYGLLMVSGEYWSIFRTPWLFVIEFSIVVAVALIPGGSHLYYGAGILFVISIIMFFISQAKLVKIEEKTKKALSEISDILDEIEIEALGMECNNKEKRRIKDEVNALRKEVSNISNVSLPRSPSGAENE